MSGSTAQIVAPAMDLTSEATASSNGPPSHVSPQSAQAVPVLAAVKSTACRLLPSRMRSPCEARTSVKQVGNHHTMMKRQPRHGWMRLLPRRRWRTRASHASAPRNAARAYRLHRRLQNRCRRRLDSWAPSLQSRGPYTLLFYLKKVISIIARLITILLTPLAHPASCTQRGRHASSCSRCSHPCSAEEGVGTPRPPARSSIVRIKGITPSELDVASQLATLADLGIIRNRFEKYENERCNIALRIDFINTEEPPRN